MEYSKLFHGILLITNQNYITDNRILLPGAEIVELSLAIDTQWMNDS